MFLHLMHHVPRMKWISSDRVSAIFILRTLFLVFVEVMSQKTSLKVIPQNKSSNNFYGAVFLLKSGQHFKSQNTAFKKLFEELFNVRRATYPFWY